MTHFFDLPKHLREVIYKRAHFLETRSRLSKILGRRATVCEYKTISSNNSLNFIWTVNLKVTDTKDIYIEVHAFNWSTELIVVDVCDYTDVRVYVHQECDRMKVFIGSEHSTRHSFVRSWQEGIAAGDERIHVQWFSDRRNRVYF